MKIVFIAFILFFQFSCGRVENIGDAAAFVATGGILPLPCSLTSSCPVPATAINEDEDNDSDDDPQVVEVLKNQPPKLEFYVDRVDLNVGDKRNLLILIRDPDDDNITRVNYFIEDPTLAVLELTEDPYELKITAKKAGNTNIRILAKDYYLNEGKTTLLPLSILEENNGLNKIKVVFTKQLIEMDVNTRYTINYIHQGLNPEYLLQNKIKNNLVKVQINKSLSSIVISAGPKAGVDQVEFTFVDSRSNPYLIRVALLIKGPQNIIGVVPPAGPDPRPPTTVLPQTPTGPRETENLVFNDPNACASHLDQISHAFGDSKNKTVSDKNSISIQSLTNGDTITLYYRELPQAAPTPFGVDITRPSIGLPLGANLRDTQRERQFILQASPLFINRPNPIPKNSQYYYLKIQGDCYRGEFPTTQSVSSLEVAKLKIKLTVNE